MVNFSSFIKVVGYATALLALYNEANRAGLVDKVKLARSNRYLNVEENYE